MARRKPMPEIWGVWEVAQFLKVAPQNLSGKNAPVGLPEPFTELKATRLWLADDIREYAPEFFERRAKLRPHRHPPVAA